MEMESDTRFGRSGMAQHDRWGTEKHDRGIWNLKDSLSPRDRALSAAPSGGSMNKFRNFLLESLPEESRKKLLENVVYTTIPENKYIFREGDPADYICIIQTGKVKLSHFDSEGRENIVMFLSENDTIWESLFLYEGRFPYSAVTVTKTRLCRIYKESFLHILDNPRASLEIIAMLSRKLHDANERNRLLTVRDPTARVAGFLLYHMERNRGSTLHYSLEEIASAISLRMETVSRRLTVLQSRGVLQRKGRGILKILDEAALRDIYEAGE